MTQTEEWNTRIWWVLVVKQFKHLLRDNFNYLDGPDPEDQSCTTAESQQVERSPTTKMAIFIQTNLSYKSPANGGIVLRCRRNAVRYILYLLVDQISFKIKILARYIDRVTDLYGLAFA